ncbi:MAG: M43 family zinc metalloprotease [Haliscomenobacter sp.]|uniref:M43 family zinc metalloprotease n=1 Tax=Haliscomenobacter sp. TaxID=2717303 RepID=UPI0029B775AA|nr:M43 family zinc metalloprotease [Haliscomenobacter sp.]MDX2072507.1 M43 family zinc metalloprotease [Haliscomenobacter sp.]
MNMFSQSKCKSFAWTIFFLCFHFVLQAQQASYPCAASEMQRLLFEKDPTLLQRQLALDEVIHQQLQRQQNQVELRNSAVFTIPVVVHIIHQNGSENISDAQIQSAIQHLNDAFAHQGYYGAAGQGTNIPIQFCLAQRTPNNQATNGITREVSSLTTMSMETDDSALKNLNRWDPRQYVNIWVVRDINSKAHGSGVAGYAYYASAHGSSFDGIVCEARYFGNSPANDVVLIHEVGHYLNLYHTFEGGCTNNNCELEGDRVCDTPPDQAKHTGCLYNSCNTDTDDTRSVNPLKTDVNDLTENYLDYSPFSCQHAFTPGQSARMLAALQTIRASLLDSPGCLPPCTQPIAGDIIVPPNLVVGTPVTFSFNGSGATRFEWKLNGSAFSNQQNPTNTFTQPGVYTLEVNAGNNDINCASRKQIKINVLCGVLADFSPKLDQVQLGDQVTFTSNGPGINTYKWTINGSLVGTGKTYTHRFNNYGDFQLQLEVSNLNCSAQSTQKIAVQSPCGDLVQEHSYAYPMPRLNSRVKVARNGDVMLGAWALSDEHKAVIMKWNATEELEWIKKERSSEWNLWDVAPLSDGNWVYLKKHRDSTNWVELVKINPKGELLWGRRFRLEFSFNNENQLIALEQTNGFLLNSFHSLSQFDNDGNLIWSKTLPDGVFLGGVQRTDGMVLLLTQEVSSKATLLLMDEKGRIIKQNMLNGLPLNAALASVYALTNNRSILRINDQNVGRLIQIDANLVPVWTKEIPNYQSNEDLIVSKNEDILLPFFEFNKVNALAFDQLGNYLWSIKLQGFQIPAGVSHGAPFLDGWKFFVPQVNDQGTKNFLLKIPNTQLPEEACFFTPGPSPGFKDIKLGVLPGKVVLSNFLLKEIPSAPIIYERIQSVRQSECRIANPCPEICNNDIDDNDNGLIDCADPTCECVECRQLPDGIISAVDSIECLGDSLRIYLKICNQGQGVLRSSTPIAFYQTDPTTSNATPLTGPKSIGINISADTCIWQRFAIKTPGSNPIFVVLNDDYRRPRPYTLERFLTERHPECTYLNNKFQFTYNPPQTPQLDLGSDQMVCNNSVTVLRATAGFARYRWFDGTSDSTLTAFSPGLYWVDAWDACGNLHSDSIRLTLQPLGDVELGPDRNICAGDTLHLSVAGFPQLKWWPAAGLNCDTCKSIIAKPDTTTRYYVTARRGSCFAGDSVLITVNAQTKLDLGPDRTLCKDSSLQVLGPLLPDLQYKWSTGAISPSISVAQSGRYILEITNQVGCVARDTLSVTFGSGFTFNLGADTTICSGETIRLPFRGIDADVYRWSTGEQGASIEVNEAGLYILEGTRDNCSWKDSIKIVLEDCNQFAVYVPNVMSTSSAVNAQFHPFFSTQTELLTYQFDIYDRWGAMVFRSQDAQQSWDGSKNGKWCNQGVYVWTLRLRYRENGQEKEAFKVGEVLLLR